MSTLITSQGHKLIWVFWNFFPSWVRVADIALHQLPKTSSPFLSPLCSHPSPCTSYLPQPGGAYLFKSHNSTIFNFLIPYSIMVYSKVLIRCFTKQKSSFSRQNKFCQSRECKKSVLCSNYIHITYELRILLRGFLNLFLFMFRSGTCKHCANFLVCVKFRKKHLTL